MSPLSLSPLPTIRAGEDSGSRILEREGFVDEAVVSALRRDQDAPFRTIPHPADLVLAADDLDFAGWHAQSDPNPFKPEKTAPAAGLARRPSPPVIEEPGFGAPHSGNHRWWLAGLAGAFSTLLFSLLLLDLSKRPGSGIGMLFVPEAPVNAPPPVVQIPEFPTRAAELTEFSPPRP